MTKKFAQIQLRALDGLTPYDRNPRTHSDAQIEQIAASLRRFGWTNPVLVDAAGGIIAGHGRVLAAKLLRQRGEPVRDHPDPSLVPVIELSRLSPDERRAYVIADNQLALKAGWDDGLLESELADLMALPDADWDDGSLGFTADELDELIRVATPDIEDTGRPAERDGHTMRPEEQATYVTVGQYRTRISRPAYDRWKDLVRAKVGFADVDVEAEIMRRLGFNPDDGKPA